MPLFLMQSITENYKMTHEIPARKNFRSSTYPREKTLDPLSTHEKIFRSHEIPTRKNFGPKKYPQRHDSTMTVDPRDPRWHATH